MLRAQHISSTLNTVGRTVKKPVALVAGYVGSGYYGLQMNPSTDAKVLPTIEDELRKALVKNNYISEANSMDLGKIKWNRSSRTDKGVHAAKIVFSAKLEFPEQLFDRTAGNTGNIYVEGDVLRFPGVVRDCNQVLPPQIRLFGCAKVNQGFNARTACHYREYEYLFPASLLFDDDVADKDRCDEECDLKIRELNGFLQQFEGCQSFHNFHRLSPRELRGEGKQLARGGRDRLDRRRQQQQAQQKTMRSDADANTDTDANSDAEGVGEAEEGDGDGYSDGDGDGDDVDVDGEAEAAASWRKGRQGSPYEDWAPRLRDTSAKTQGNVYRCRASLLSTHDDDASPSTNTNANANNANANAGERMVLVRIAGQSFLLHQIRLMMSAAILSALGHVPRRFLALALSAAQPVHLPLPLAP
eukprot:gene38596-46921_t